MFHIAFLYLPVLFSGECISYGEIWLHEGEHFRSAWWAMFTIQLLFLIWITYQLTLNWHLKKERFVWAVTVLFPVITMFGLTELKEFADFQSSGKSAHAYIDEFGAIQHEQFIHYCKYRDKSRTRYCPKSEGSPQIQSRE